MHTRTCTRISDDAPCLRTRRGKRQDSGARRVNSPPRAHPRPDRRKVCAFAFVGVCEHLFRCYQLIFRAITGMRACATTRGIIIAEPNVFTRRALGTRAESAISSAG